MKRFNSLLNNHFKLIFKRGHVTDRASRTFKNISTFEYELWAKDKHMWSLMIECISKNLERKDSRSITGPIRGALIEASGTSMQMALVKRDLVAVQMLWKERTKDFINLKSELEKLMIVDNQPSNYQY